MENKWLYQYKKKITSQFGEDGILEKIFEVLGIDKGFVVDVGAGNLHNSNSWELMNKGWSGLFIDADKNRLRNLKRHLNSDRSEFINVKIEPGMLDDLCKSDFDLLCLDIDGNDYYVWESLRHTPKVVLIEFNPCIKFNDYLQEKDGKGGCSLSMLIKLGKTKGYELVSATEINAFFVRKEFFSKFGIEDNSVETLFVNSDKGYGRDKTDYSK